MKKIVVTGGNGRVGSFVIKELLNHGYEVINADIKMPDEILTKTIVVDLNRLSDCYYVLKNADAVIHMAAIPNPFKNPDDVVFQNNVMSTYNILEACSNLGIKKVVIGSSEASYGICNAPISPLYVPLDEKHIQRPYDCYGLSKVVNEQTAKSFNLKTGMQIVAMRLGNVIDPIMYKNFSSFIHDSKRRRHLLWSYIDARDAAVACRLAIEKDNLGYIELNIAADDTSMDIKSIDLMKLEYPNVIDIRSDLSEYQTILSNKLAKEVLNWKPIHSWRDYKNEIQVAL